MVGQNPESGDCPSNLAVRRRVLFVSEEQPMKKRKHGFPFKRVLAVFWGAMLTGNVIAGVRIGKTAAADSLAEADSSLILQQAVAYLENRINSDGSIGNGATVNDTADAMRVLRQEEEYDLSGQYAWIGQNLKPENTDISARIVSGTGNPAYLADILTAQNADGGFGLNAGYSSDVPDTQLVLAAVNDCGGGELTEAGKKASRYLSEQVASDGSFAYTEASPADSVLTAAVLYDLSRFAAIEQNADAPSVKTAEQTAAYIRSNPSGSYADEKIEETVTQQLALYTYDGKIDTGSVISSLKQAQKPDGSFAESVHVTALAVQLVRAVNAGKYMNLTAFRTDLSTDTVTEGESDAVTAKTLIAYQSNCSGDYNLRMTVKNGTSVVYENSTKVTIPEGEDSLSVETGSFRLIESEDRGITVTVDLLDGEKLIRSEVIAMTLKGHTPVKASAVNAFTVSLDNYYTLAGVPTKVCAAGTVLYSANSDQKAEVHAEIRKDGNTVREMNGQALLSTEHNSVTIPLFDEDIDTSAPAEYEFCADCIYNGKTVFSDSRKFTVVARPEPKQSDPDSPTDARFDVQWMSPILSDTVVYAGRKNDISAKAAIIYDSDAAFTGKLSLKAVSGEEVLAENAVDLTLEPVDLSAADQLKDIPKYETESLLSFVADAVGEITVAAVLTDSEGTEIASASRTVSIIEKPVQDLILYADTDERNGSVDLRWNDISNEQESYVYQLNRRVQGGQWEPRSIWNEEEHIRILNVYPAGAYLAQWMNSPLGDTGLTAGMGIFEIDSVHFRDFNPNPEETLKNKDGSWKYDVLFFGTSDCNGGYDLSDAAYEVVQEFVDDGRGVLFGHDTVNAYLGYKNFVRFADQLGIKLINDSYSATSSASVVKIGTMTNYPWTLRGTLTIPTCHTSGQYVGGTLKATEWMTLNATQRIDPETGGHSNSYLVTNNNLGMIQTGHSGGSATDDERKVIANTLFYLYQISRLTTAKDTSFYDIAAPDKPEADVKPLENGAYEITAESKDNGTTYEYVILANPASGDDGARASNTITNEVKSGLAGFFACFSDSDETGDNVLNLQPANTSGKATLAIRPESSEDGRFIHIFAIDKANNISEECIAEAAVLNLQASVRTDKKRYLPGETVLVDSDTAVRPFGVIADGKLRIVDEYDNPTEILAEMPAQQLTASDSVQKAAEWKVPAATYGRYKAVLTWEKDGEVLAESECVFKVSGEESIADAIASNKKTYTTSEPVNLSTKVMNQSSNLVENDLTLRVTVRSVNGAENAVFTREIASVNPQGIMEFADAVKGGTLLPGTYVAEAAILQDETEIAADTAEFTVTDSVEDFTGTLEFTRSGKTVEAAFTVSNTGSADAAGAEITVTAYAEDGTQVFTVTKKADIQSGDTVSFKEPFSAAELAAGDYSGVLSVRYEETQKDLAYAGFTVGQETTVVTEKTTVTTTTSASESTAEVTGTDAGALATGVKGIPWYIWTMLCISCIGLFATLRKTGGRKEHE